jgi:histone H3/H4
VIPARTVVLVGAQRQEVNLTVDRAVRSAVGEYVRVSDDAQATLGRLLRREAERLAAGQTAVAGRAAAG